MRNKTCFKCGETKSIEDFYRHARMADGHLNKCKECAKKDVCENRSSRRLQYAAYERQRNQESNRKAKQMDYSRRRRVEYPEKYAARVAVNNALRDRKLEKESCQVCGTTNNVEGHHEDYSRPLDVQWLCFAHHCELHGRVAIETRA